MLTHRKPSPETEPQHDRMTGNVPLGAQTKNPVQDQIRTLNERICGFNEQLMVDKKDSAEILSHYISRGIGYLAPVIVIGSLSIIFMA